MSRKDVPIVQVDAFTNEPFRGNPAAVCVLDQPREAAWMQAVAAEMNLSETAFLVPEKDGFNLRWFTPAVEVRICGHATLASAHALWEMGAAPAASGELRFYTKSGMLTAYRKDDGIELDFPAYTTEPIELSDEVSTAFPARPKNAVAVKDDAMGHRTLLLELESADAVRSLEPRLAPLRRPDAPGVIITARSDASEWDCVSRCFFACAGIDEDPATGSAHCVIGPYWGSRLGKDELVGYQASRRGAVIGMRMEGARVRLRGRAVTVLRGTLLA